MRMNAGKSDIQSRAVLPSNQRPLQVPGCRQSQHDRSQVDGTDGKLLQVLFSPHDHAPVRGGSNPATLVSRRPDGGNLDSNTTIVAHDSLDRLTPRHWTAGTPPSVATFQKFYRRSFAAHEPGEPGQAREINKAVHKTRRLCYP